MVETVLCVFRLDESVTSPPEEITVQCPKCGHSYEDWFRASINLDLDPFDSEYREECSTAKCPQCTQTVNLDMLIVENGVFMLELVGHGDE